MSRRARKEAIGVALFPFLAVLICTMGALIVLLVMIVQQADVDAKEEVADLSRVQAVSSVQTQQRRGDYEEAVAIREMLEKSRGEMQQALADRRAELSHLEDHIRRLNAEGTQLLAQVQEIEEGKKTQTKTVAVLKAELAKNKDLIAAKKKTVEAKKKKAADSQQWYALIPYDGTRGTRRRPIYIECVEEGIIVQPEGVMITVADLAGPLGPGNPLDAVLRAKREYLAKSLGDKAGEPYPLLVVRPGGVQSYAAARRAMTAWDDEFGYELISEEKKLDFGPRDPQVDQMLEKVVVEARKRQTILARAMNFTPRDSDAMLPSAGEPAANSLAARAASRSGLGTGRGPGGGLGNGIGGDGGMGDGSGPAGRQNGAGGSGPGGNGLGGGSGLANGDGSGGSPAGNGLRGSGHATGTNNPYLAGYSPAGGGGGGTKGGASGKTGGGNGRGSGPNSVGARDGIGGAGGDGSSDGTGGPSATGNGGNLPGDASTGAGPVAGGGKSGGKGRGQGGAGVSGGAAGGDLAEGGTAGATGGGSSSSSGGSRGSGGGSPLSGMSGSQSSGGMQGSASQSPNGAGQPSGLNLTMGSQGGPGAQYEDDAKSSRRGSDKKGDRSKDKTARGHNWGLPNAKHHLTPVSRQVRVQCFGDRLVIVPGQGEDRPPQQIKISPDEMLPTEVDGFVKAVHKYMDSWGLALADGYWKPVLNVEVAPGAESRFDELRTALQGSGLDLKRKTR